MWICVVLDIIIIIYLFWENRALKTSIEILGKNFEEDFANNRQYINELRKDFLHYREIIKEELVEVKENENNIYENVTNKLKGVERCLEEFNTRQINETEKYFEEFSILKSKLENISELCGDMGKKDKKYYSETKKIINSFNEKYNLLQQKFNIIEELFRLQLVNSLIDDANNAMKFYEETKKEIIIKGK